MREESPACEETLPKAAILCAAIFFFLGLRNSAAWSQMFSQDRQSSAGTNSSSKPVDSVMALMPQRSGPDLVRSPLALTT